MEINTNINTRGVKGLTHPKRAAASAKTAGDGVSFGSSAALEKAVKSLPEVRPDAVNRAKALINDPNYPSSGTVRKLSEFLASNLGSDQE